MNKYILLSLLLIVPGLALSMEKDADLTVTTDKKETKKFLADVRAFLEKRREGLVKLTKQAKHQREKLLKQVSKKNFVVSSKSLDKSALIIEEQIKTIKTSKGQLERQVSRNIVVNPVFEKKYAHLLGLEKAQRISSGQFKSDDIKTKLGIFADFADTHPDYFKDEALHKDVYYAYLKELFSTYKTGYRTTVKSDTPDDETGKVKRACDACLPYLKQIFNSVEKRFNTSQGKLSPRFIEDEEVEKYDDYFTYEAESVLPSKSAPEILQSHSRDRSNSLSDQTDKNISHHGRQRSRSFNDGDTKTLNK